MDKLLVVKWCTDYGVVELNTNGDTDGLSIVTISLSHISILAKLGDFRDT